jgi:flagellar M-ring protein FliF
MAQLAVYPGVVVGVDVELDPTLRRESIRFDIDPKMTAPLRSRDSQKTSTNTQPTPAGRPGTASNGVGNTPQTVGTESGAKSETNESLTEQDLEISRNRSLTVDQPLPPKKVKVSIGVPSSYYERVWRERNPPAAGATPAAPAAAEIVKIEQEVKKEIEESVVNLLPVPEPGGDPYIPVRVTSFTDIPLEAESPPGMVDEATSWLAGNWPTLGMVLLGLVSLVMLRGMLRSTAVAAAPPPSTAAAQSKSTPSLAVAPNAEVRTGETPEQTWQRRLRARREGGPSLRDELVEMVKEDPDAAANVLRNWIGDAA